VHCCTAFFVLKWLFKQHCQDTGLLSHIVDVLNFDKVKADFASIAAFISQAVLF